MVLDKNSLYAIEAALNDGCVYANDKAKLGQNAFGILIRRFSLPFNIYCAFKYSMSIGYVNSGQMHQQITFQWYIYIKYDT